MAPEIVLLVIRAAVALLPPTPAECQTPMVKMKGETARERLHLIRENLLPGGGQYSDWVPAGQRLVVTNLLISSEAMACGVHLKRMAPGEVCLVSSHGVALTPSLCVPLTGGTVSHAFGTGLVIPQGERLCVARGSGAGTAAAEVLVTGYYTKAKN